jgi:hypothetical protein
MAFGKGTASQLAEKLYDSRFVSGYAFRHTAKSAEMVPALAAAVSGEILIRAGREGYGFKSLP